MSIYSDSESEISVSNVGIPNFTDTFTGYFYNSRFGSLSVSFSLSLSTNRLYDLVKDVGMSTYSGVNANELTDCILVVEDIVIPRSDFPICHVCNITSSSDIYNKTIYIYLSSETLPTYITRN